MKDRVLIQWVAGGVFSLLVFIGGMQIKTDSAVNAIKVEQAKIFERQNSITQRFDMHIQDPNIHHQGIKEIKAQIQQR